MKVSFQATLDDYIDIAMRSAGSRHVYYQSLVFVAIGVGTVAGGLGYLVGRSWTAAAIGFALGAVFILIYNYGRYERFFRKFYSERLPLNEPSLVTAEITPQGITFDQNSGKQGEKIFRTWDTIECIEETFDTIYFVKKGKLYSAVRKRAFANDADMKEFLDLANRYRSEAMVPKPKPTFDR
jgi:hypothetical protein